jgi:hypothetical protein
LLKGAKEVKSSEFADEIVKNMKWIERSKLIFNDC